MPFIAEALPRFNTTKVVEAKPKALGDDALQLRVAPERNVSRFSLAIMLLQP